MIVYWNKINIDRKIGHTWYVYSLFPPLCIQYKNASINAIVAVN